MQVAVPEFDGRLITVPFSFKEAGRDGVPVYVADPERAARVAGIALAHARLRHTPPGQRRLAIMLSSYPTKHARVGNAVGLDTPASAVVLLRALREAGYDTGDEFPEDGDTLIHTLIATGGHDVEWLTEEQLAAAPMRVPAAEYGAWFAALPGRCARRCAGTGATRPASCTSTADEIVLAGLRFGNVLLMIQPPRGFGENPMAIYHDPDLPPSHHYLAAYRWLEAGVRRARGRAPGQARHLRVAARQGPRPVRGVRAGRGARRPAAGLPVHRERPRRGHPGQAARPRDDHRPPDPADGPRRQLRRPGQAGAAAGRVRHGQRAGPGQAPGRPGPDLGADLRRATAPRPARGRRARRPRSSTTSCCTWTGTCARSRTR